MRIRSTAMLAMLAAVSSAGPLAACTSGSSSTVVPPPPSAPATPSAPHPSPRTPPAPNTAPAPSAAPAPPPSQQRPTPSTQAPSGHGIGDTQTLRGQSDGEAVAVTLTRFVDPATAGDEFSTPSAGDRLVGTQFRVANAGTVPYNDVIDSDVQLIDRKGQAYSPEIGISITSGRLFQEVRIQPGDSRLGFVVFSVPTGVRLTSVQFVPDSGFANDTAQWTLPPGRAPSSESAAPADVVRAYFAAINAADYQRAWDVGGKNLGGSYEAFVDGFADTVRDTVTITATRGNVVSMTLDAEQTDGSTRTFVGTYTVRDGVIVAAHVRRQ